MKKIQDILSQTNFSFTLLFKFMIKYIVVLLTSLLLLLQNVAAQQDSAMQKFSISFSEYLLKEHLYNDAGLYLKTHPNNTFTYYYVTEKLKFQTQKFGDKKWSLSDSLQDFKTPQLYQNQYLFYRKLNQLHQTFEYMPENISAFFNENKKQENIWNIASINVSADSTKWKKVFAIQLLTKNLMLHDTIAFKKGYENFKANYPHQFNYSLETMMNNYNDLQKIKNKNVLKAGLLSA
ncbi:MAG: hypothetical protein RL065_1338, partial [Bacteroidota bacterium]